ncbi:MAG: M23 family metallopeptidase, partial [Atribacterota bacterium]
TLLLGFLVLVIGVGGGIGGVLWYQRQIRMELRETSTCLENLRGELVSLEMKKKENEKKLQDLTGKAEKVIREMNTLRKLDQKVRGALEKDLESQLKKYGLNIAFSTSSDEIYTPVQFFTSDTQEEILMGAGGPFFASFGVVSFKTTSLRPAYDPQFTTKAKFLDDNLDWLRAEMMVREKSFKEIIKITEKRDKLVNMVPMRWPTWGKVTSSYGWRRDPFTGRKGWHTGVDIAAPQGRNVVATADGQVIFAGWNGNYGRCVIVQHQFGYETVYGHLAWIKVKEGDNVSKTEIIGKVGSTGRSTAPHLHYEVRKYRNIVNPWPYLP